MGNAAYKKKDFEAALKHYGLAIEKDPTSVIFRNNRAGLYLFLIGVWMIYNFNSQIILKNVLHTNDCIYAGLYVR